MHSTWIRLTLLYVARYVVELNITQYRPEYVTVKAKFHYASRFEAGTSFEPASVMEFGFYCYCHCYTS